jgi:excisionase family DNA binding protein
MYLFFRPLCNIVHPKERYGSGMKIKLLSEEKIFEGYPDVVNVSELCLMLGGISKKLAYRLLSHNEIRSIKIGREYKIPKNNIRDYLLK